MSDAVATLYQQVDNLLENLRDQAEGDQERDRIAYQQKLNEQACFVLAWEQRRDGQGLPECYPLGKIT